MREQYENNNPESKGVHIDMMKFPYTHQARNMYTFSQSEKIFKKDSYHDKLIDEIFDVLSKGKPEKQTERELRDLLSGEGIYERISMRYLEAEKHRTHHPVKKYTKKLHTKDNTYKPIYGLDKAGIDYDAIGAQLARNFIHISILNNSPENSLDAFVEEKNTCSNLQLRQYIENYILDEDEEGENEDLDIVETAKNPWIPFTIASMLIRRSEKWEDLKYAMEALSYVKEDIWDEFYGWEEYNLTPEFHTGAEKELDYLLWSVVCELARTFAAEIGSTHKLLQDTMQKNEEELLHSDVYTPMFFDFFEDIKIYISEDLHADDSVFYDLYEHYVDIVKMSQVENDDTFDQYGGEENEEK